jgi:hypothetical protein
MESEVYHKCTGCRILRSESEYEIHKGMRRKSCMKCKRKRIKQKADSEKDHIKTLITSLQSKIDQLSLASIPKTLEEYCKNDCSDAAKLSDFIEFFHPIRLRQSSDLVNMIREIYLKLHENKRPFYSKHDELFVKINEWKAVPYQDFLITLGEAIAEKCGNTHIKFEDDFVNELMKMTKI